MSTPTLRCAVASDDVLGETPLWCVPTQSLLWIDIDRGHLNRWHPATGRRDRFAFSGEPLGSLALTAVAGRVVVALGLALHRFDLATGALQRICEVEPRGADNRLNDGRCDSRGRLWIGTMDNQLHRPNGSFYRIDPDGHCERQFGDVIVSNSVALSPDERVLYFSDTRRFVTWSFDLDVHGGTLRNRRVFVDHTGTRSRPDGACVDAQGFVWTAIFAGKRVVRHSPQGAVDRVIDLPVTNPTCVCLGGPELKTLYITTARKFIDDAGLQAEPWAGSVLACEVDVAGLPERHFG